MQPKDLILSGKRTDILNVSSTVSRVKRSTSAKLFQPKKLLHNFAILHDVVDMPCAVPVKTDHYGIILAHSGSCLKTSGRFEFEVLPKSLHFVSSETIHAYGKISADMRLSMLLFSADFIAGSYLKEDILSNLVETSPVIAPYFQLNEAQYAKFKGLFDLIAEEYHSDKPFNLQVVKLLIIQTLYEMNRTCEQCLYHSSRHLSRQYQLVSAFRKMVDEDFLEKRTVQEYAEKLNVSTQHLSRVIRLETGLSVLLIIHNRLLLEAQYLLASSNCSIKQVALHLGFDTSSHFGRFFKNMSGINPSDYK